MTGRRSARLLSGGTVLLALIGVWLGHTIEYVRVWGLRGLDQVLFGSVHAYMLPLAAVLAVGAALFGIRLAGVWIALGRRLELAQSAFLALLLRGRCPDDLPMPEAVRASTSARVMAAWPAITLLQIALYVYQENVEALAAHLPAPGLGAITGVHALAPLVHAGVSLVLVSAAALGMRLLRRRERTVERLCRAIRAAMARLHRAPAVAALVSQAAFAPARVIGRHLDRRPPPAFLPA